MAGGSYRPLTKQERELLAWLLENGPTDARNYLPLLDVISARSSCDCGCPSIEFSVPLDAPFIEVPMGMRLDFTGTADGYEVGLMLVAGSGVLSELEVYTFGGNDGPFALPRLDTLKPFAKSQSGVAGE
jgi:hypothetical protein